MKKNILVLLALVVVALLQSCSIEKRRYMDGYHVEWNHRKSHGVLVKSSDTHCEEPQLTAQENSTPTSSVDEQGVTHAIDIVTEENQLKEVRVPARSARKTDVKTDLKTDSVKTAMERNHSEYEKNDLTKPLSGQVSFDENSSGDEELILLVILAILLPPLAVFLKEGSWNNLCWISLILTLCFWLPGIIFALWIVLR